jgi:hypothetical protein
VAEPEQIREMDEQQLAQLQRQIEHRLSIHSECTHTVGHFNCGLVSHLAMPFMASNPLILFLQACFPSRGVRSHTLSLILFTH